MPDDAALLVDGFAVDGERYRKVIRGDSQSAAIAAASIIAKTTRDRMMHEYAAVYPAYGFERHAGYITSAHSAAVVEYGPSPIHRLSYRARCYHQRLSPQRRSYMPRRPRFRWARANQEMKTIAVAPKENELHHADRGLPIVGGLCLFRSHASAGYPHDEAVVRGIGDRGDQVDRDRQGERDQHHARRPLQGIERHANGGVSRGNQSNSSAATTAARRVSGCFGNTGRSCWGRSPA